jgi:hypothetical protein
MGNHDSYSDCDVESIPALRDEGSASAAAQIRRILRCSKLSEELTRLPRCGVIGSRLCLCGSKVPHRLAWKSGHLWPRCCKQGFQASFSSTQLHDGHG